jgi:RHS repeat-associated protein
MNSKHGDKARSVSIFGLFLCFIASSVFAQTRPPETIYKIDWNERLNPNVGLKAHDDGLLDDKIDFSTGRLSFETVDVSLPGNSALPVEIRRRRNPSHAYYNEFADWQLAVPSISTKIPQLEVTKGLRWGKTRCSASLSSSIPNSTFGVSPFGGGAQPVPPSRYSDGVLLDVPGVSSSHLLDKTVTASWPTAAQKVTTNGWYFTCIPNVDGNGTEGFSGRAPNGDRYTFNVMKWRKFVSYDDVWRIEYSNVNGNVSFFDKNWYFYDTLAVSQVTDVNGNWVNYSYDSLGRLTSIAANDGRQININYWDSTSNQIASVVANPGTASQRQWTYQYGYSQVNQYAPPASADGMATIQAVSVYTLTSVTLPNGRQWLYNLAGLTVQAVPGTSYRVNFTGPQVNCIQQNQTVSVTHPDGVVGTFVVQERGAFIAFNGFSGPEGPPCPNSSYGRSPLTTPDVMAVTSKSLAVPGMPTSTWSYTYTNANAPTADSTNKATINLPDGTKRIKSYKYPDSYSALLKEETFSSVSSTTPLETVSYTYGFDATAGSDFVASNTTEVYTPLRQQLVTITRGSDWYKTQNTYVTDRTAANYSWGFPTNISQWSSLGGGTRSADIVYSHDQTNWILGLPSTVTKNGKLFDSYGYDASGRLTTHQRFGATLATLGYYTSGAQSGRINWVRDALNRQTTFSNWYRGSPQAITRSDNSNIGFSIDANGWVKSSTDALNATTSYAYDSVGRLTQIMPPSPWNATNIGYSYSGGYLYQTATKGSAQTTTTYNAMLWPIQVLAQSLSGVGNNIYTNTSYDPLGRVTFASLPSATAGSSIGILSTYDALGRVTQTQETASGGGTTYFAYLAGNATRVTDPSGNLTTNTASGWGDPGDGNVVKTQKPEGITFDFGYDIYGNQISLAQTKDDGSQLLSTFQYDANLRLCRRKVPETGDTLYSYNAANEMTAYAEGQASGTGCATPPAGSAVNLGYDALGRLQTTDYPGTTPDISRTYDFNGNLLTINRGGANWTYTYNAIGLIETEQMVIDARTYLIDPEYDPDGALIRKRYPSGRTYNFVNDGYGRPTDVYFGSTVYLSSAAYHPNGKLASLNRGTGGTYQQNLNARQLVSYIGGNWGTSMSYGYDAAGRIISIDSPNDSYDRTLTYDGVGRLKTASGPWGAGNYSYDRLGNIRTRTEGTRTVTTNYTSLNRVNQVQDTAQGSAWRTYSHDTRGNVTGDGIHGFTYDFANQPVTLTGPDAGSFAYDGNLKRVKQVIDGKTIYSIYDRAGAILTRDDATSVEWTDFITLGGQTFVRLTNGSPSFPVNDHLGSAYMVANMSGGITAARTFNFTPFGEGIGNDPGTLNRQGYTGHIEDETGLTYMQARYYDPVIGRFLSADPIGFADQLNLYAYVRNDPVNGTDPTGLVGELHWTAPNEVTYTVRYTVVLKDGVKPSFTPQDVRNVVRSAYSGTVNMNGTQVKVTAQAIPMSNPGKNQVNTVTVVKDTQGVTASGRAQIDKIGGSQIIIGATGTEAATATTVGHEVGGHAGGAGDQYKDGVDASGNKLSADVPGPANIMKDLTGAGANQQTLKEIITAPTNTNTCAKGVSAANGGC